MSKTIEELDHDKQVLIKTLAMVLASGVILAQHAAGSKDPKIMLSAGIIMAMNAEIMEAKK